MGNDPRRGARDERAVRPMNARWVVAEKEVGGGGRGEGGGGSSAGSLDEMWMMEAVYYSMESRDTLGDVIQVRRTREEQEPP